jgi:peptide/nickel transport system permease protein
MVFLLRRLLIGIPTIVGIAVLVFVILLLMPGNPAELIQGDMVNPSVTQALVEKWGLNDPPLSRFVRWSASVLRLDFGTSLVTGQPVADMLLPRLGYSAYLGVLGIIFGVLLGIPAGIISAVKRNSWFDDVLTILTLLGVSLPTFVLALILQLTLGFKLRLLPISGSADSLLDPNGIRYAILPALSIGAYQAAINARMVRTALIDILHNDYIRTARSKGVREIHVLVNHALPNAMILVLNLLGVYLKTIIAGLLLVEIVFGWPGTGRLFYDAVRQRDYPVIQAVALTIGIGVYLVNLVVDFLYMRLDPRMRMD